MWARCYCCDAGLVASDDVEGSVVDDEEAGRAALSPVPVATPGFIEASGVVVVAAGGLTAVSLLMFEEAAPVADAPVSAAAPVSAGAFDGMAGALVEALDDMPVLAAWASI